MVEFGQKSNLGSVYLIIMYERVNFCIIMIPRLLVITYSLNGNNYNIVHLYIMSQSEKYKAITQAYERNS